MRAGESYKWLNIAATSLPVGANVAAGSVANSFAAQGGYYALSSVATTYGTVQLNMVGPDGATLINAGAAITANGIIYIYLPEGQYVLSVAGATGLYVAITRVALSD